MTTTILTGDCRELLSAMEPNTVDAVVTDPPYGIGFMGREWDTFSPSTVAAEASRRQRKGTERTSAAYPDRMSKTSQGGGPIGSYDESAAGNRRFQDWTEDWARECFRVLKPGGHMLVCGGPRTFHRVASGIEDAGFQIRDVLSWLYGSGFPKSHNLADDWQGWGTALKPGWEPIIMARKPFRGTVAANVAEHGTGAINVDACRVDPGSEVPGGGGFRGGAGSRHEGWDRPSHAEGSATTPHALGRWPANVVLDEDAAAMLDEQSGQSVSRIGKPRGAAGAGDGWGMTATGAEYDDAGGASRFFYVAKASRSERNAGLEGMPKRRSVDDDWVSESRKASPGGGIPSPQSNHHPTVKPVSLMRWLIRMVVPTGGVVLDPFAGSFTTGVAAVAEGFDCILMEREPEYVEIGSRRVAHAETLDRQLMLGVA